MDFGPPDTWQRICVVSNLQRDWWLSIVTLIAGDGICTRIRRVVVDVVAGRAFDGGAGASYVWATKPD